MTTEPKPETTTWHAKLFANRAFWPALLVIIAAIFGALGRPEAEQAINDLLSDKSTTTTTVTTTEPADGDHEDEHTTPLPGPAPGPQPIPGPAIPPSFAVSLEGPSQVASGGFAIVATLPADARASFTYDLPPGAMPPIELRDAQGRAVLVSLQPPAGVHTVRVLAQQAAPGFDPLATDEHRVTVGSAPVAPPVVQPTPGPGPNPPPPVEPPPNPPPPASSLVLFLYESSAGALPPYVAGAINQLRAAGRTVYLVDVDDTTGLDAVPTWMQPAVAPAKAVGLPAIAHIADGKLVKPPVKVPATLEAVVEAAK